MIGGKSGTKGGMRESDERESKELVESVVEGNKP